jgi:hypothetical protein
MLTTSSVTRLAAVCWFVGLMGLLVVVGIPALAISALVHVVGGGTLHVTRDLWVVVALPMVVAGQAVVVALLIGFGYWIVRRYRPITINGAS